MLVFFIVAFFIGITCFLIVSYCNLKAMEMSHKLMKEGMERNAALHKESLDFQRQLSYQNERGQRLSTELTEVILLEKQLEKMTRVNDQITDAVTQVGSENKTKTKKPLP